jgi:hypothetical protein
MRTLIRDLRARAQAPHNGNEVLAIFRTLVAESA